MRNQGDNPTSAEMDRASGTDFRSVCTDAGMKPGSILVAMSAAPYKRTAERLLWALCFCGYDAECEEPYFSTILDAYKESY